jgi:hypothetical protein
VGNGGSRGRVSAPRVERDITSHMSSYGRELVAAPILRPTGAIVGLTRECELNFEIENNAFTEIDRDPRAIRTPLGNHIIAIRA